MADNFWHIAAERIQVPSPRRAAVRRTAEEEKKKHDEVAKEMKSWAEKNKDLLKKDQKKFVEKRNDELKKHGWTHDDYIKSFSLKSPRSILNVVDDDTKKMLMKNGSAVASRVAAALSSFGLVGFEVSRTAIRIVASLRKK